MRGRMLTFSDFLVLCLSLHTETHTYQDFYSHSPLWPEQAWDCFSESFITPGKPLAWPEGGYGQCLPVKPRAADHFHYSIKPLA